MKACGSMLGLEYIAVRLRTQLREQDWNAHTKGSSEFETLEPTPCLRSFITTPEAKEDIDTDGPGFVQRTWRWMSIESADADIHGLHRPKDSIPVRLKHMQQGSLLIGIECSAPHKS